MTRTNFPRFVLMLTFNLTLVFGYSQATHEAVILINNSPVKAEISADGTIIRVIENLGKEDLIGFALKESDYVAYLKKIAPTDKPKTQSTETLEEPFIVDLAFKSKSEVLDDQAIALLEKVVTQMRENPNQKITLKTLQNKDGATIHTTRSNNIKSYLVLRGVAESKLKFEPSIANKDANEVKIYIK